MAAAVGAPDSHLSSDDVTVLSSTDPVGAETQISPGQSFGPYRIDRLLGRGGMGEVYEAEHLEHGRRVALKVLGRRLSGPDDRARFLREGQLAASISHPHTVYIFGSEEISGTPVISMELVAGGTLKDLVERDGPMKPALAVDAMLDVIAGLDAAQAGGILHRDIKPSNCFVDPDGRVKVGDFGLSISTLARDVGRRSELGGFQGTPRYAAPEQLRGQPLDLRADIYAAGATLYYLLTGHAPFEDEDLMTLVTRVTTEAPVSPRQERPAVPQGLAGIVLQCLAKERADRPASYAALEDALRPFSSAAPTPSALGLRFVAGSIDWLLLLAFTVPITLTPVLKFTPPASVDFSVSYSGATERDASTLIKVLVCIVTYLYYTLLEGFGGASIGKRVCGLRVAHEGRNPGLARAALRTALFMAPMLWPIFGPQLISEPPGGKPDLRFGLTMAGSTVLGFLISWVGFTTIRRRNGYAALHDLASRTRVVLRRQHESRVPLDGQPASTAPTSSRRRIGPFEVTGTLGPAGAGELVAGFDPVLRRAVWLHLLPDGAPALSAARRDVGRPGRLHWLAGHRRAGDTWDAFEAPDGAALLSIARTRQPWRMVRHWLADLTRELEAGRRDGTTPDLALDRVWITRGSRAVLLDFPAPGLGALSSSAPLPPQRFVNAVAATSLNSDPVPLSARQLLDALEHNDVPAETMSNRMMLFATRAARITPWRRAMSIALANVPVIAVIIAVLAMLPLMTRVMRQDFLLPMNCLIEINTLEGKTDDASGRLRRSLEIYCAARYGALYTDDGFWSDRRAHQITEPLRPLAQRVMSTTTAATPAEVARAEMETRTTLGEQDAKQGARTGLAISIALPSAALLVCAVLALLSSLLVRGGVMMRLLGLAIVDRRGHRVSRWRGTWRAVIAWSPVLVLWAYFGLARLLGRNFEDTFLTVGLVILAIGAAVAGASWTVAHPGRGVQDRLAGTWVVAQ